MGCQIKILISNTQCNKNKNRMHIWMQKQCVHILGVKVQLLKIMPRYFVGFSIPLHLMFLNTKSVIGTSALCIKLCLNTMLFLLFFVASVYAVYKCMYKSCYFISLNKQLNAVH